MKYTVFFFIIITIISCNNNTEENVTQPEVVSVAYGKMPALTFAKNELHVIYGSNDSLLYTASSDNGSDYQAPQLLDVIPGLVASATRGPQIAPTNNGLAVLAVNNAGDILSYTWANNKWTKTARVNDVDTINKEGFVALAGDGKDFLFAVWPDLRNDNFNKIVGSRSFDGGQTWEKNKVIYRSPDSTVCECCKQSVTVKGDRVIIMFRNWLDGNRDMYVIESYDKGKTFGDAEKLGNGNWALNGCPMDGGNLTIDGNEKVQTVWKREQNIFACESGMNENLIGKGRGCTLESINDDVVYAWAEEEDIKCLLPNGKSLVIGKGSLPTLEKIDNENVLCMWQNDGRIMSKVLHL